MKTYTEYIAAGVTLTLAVGGTLLYVQRSEAGQVLDIEFIKDRTSQGVQGVGKGFKAKPVGGFDTVRIKAAVGGTVTFVVTDGDLNAQFDDANTIIGNEDGQAVPIRTKAGERLPVDLAGGNVTVTMGSMAEIIDHVPSTINTGAAQLLVNDPTFKRLRIRNAHATAIVYLGGAALTAANATIELKPGEMWVEDDAPAIAWYATSDTDGADVRVMGVA